MDRPVGFGYLRHRSPHEMRRSLLASYSDDNGKSFSDPVPVSEPSRERVVAPALVLGADHLVHVAYYDLKDDARDYLGLQGPTWEGTWSVVLSTSFDAGRHFDRTVVVDDDVVPPERVMLIFTMPPPSVVADRKLVCAAWTDARHGDPDALVRCSSTRGATWKKPIRLNDDPVGNGRRQYMPRLALSPDGRLDAIFFDRREDPENRRNHLYYTFSADGGAHFAHNVRLTGRSSDTRIGQQYINVSAEGQVEFGSRLALLSHRSGALAAWPDTRNARLATTEQDLFAAEIHLPRRGHPSVQSSVIGAGLLGLGILIIGGARLKRVA